jgi:WS/DGAT/MGAT family acyltransferase
MSVARLSSIDLMFLRQESLDWPGHFGGLAVVEGKVLMDGSGQLRMQEIRQRMNRRLARVPHLRWRLYFPGPLGGRPIWVDDHQFAIQHHVHETAVEQPGGELQLMDAAARIYGQLLDRSHPLWELWFLTGVSDGRVGVLLKLHHSVADGMAAMTIISSLFDFEPDAPDPAFEQWAAQPIPTAWSLVADNLAGKIGAATRAAWTLAHPLRLVRGGRAGMKLAREAFGQTRAPRTSLNQVVRSGRRMRFLRLDLATMKAAAHAHETKVNDVVLDLWAGGLRELMRQRGEPTAGVELVTNMPVSLRSAAGSRGIDNEFGILALPLPVWEPDVQRRLDLIVSITRKARSEQHAAAIAGFLAAASAAPFAKFFTARQHSVNVKVTNVAGPPVPVYVLGARVLDIVPITRLFGNVGLTLCALSYAGDMYLVVTADATAFPDLDVLMAGIEQDWQSLSHPRGDTNVHERPSRSTLERVAATHA